MNGNHDSSGGPALPQARTRILVVGMQGTGKSEKVKAALRKWLRQGLRVVAVDPLDEYSRHGRQADGLVCLGPLRDRVTPQQLAANPAILLERRLSLAVVPSGGPRQWARAMSLVASLLPHAGRALLVVDEVGTLCDGSLHPDCHKARADLAAIATTGRHTGVALVLVSQRAATIPINARSLATEVWAFQQTEPDDIQALAAKFRDSELADQVAALKPFECVEWNSTATPKPQQSTPAPLRAISGEKP